MSSTRQKGMSYPSLKLSSFRVKEDCTPPEVQLPPEVECAVKKPLPEPLDDDFAKEMIQLNLKLLEKEEARKAKQKAIVEEEGRKKAEAERAEAAAKERASQIQSEERAKKIDSVCSITGESRSAAVARLEQLDWDIQKAVHSFYGD